MDHNFKLRELCRRLRMPGACQSSVSFEEAEELLEANDDMLDAATYEGCLRNADNTTVTAGDVRMEKQREYWLSLARSFRPNRTGTLRRADGGGGCR